jgi:malonyl-ACP decarboxylase
MSTQGNIVVTGMGIITPIGIGLKQFTQGLREGCANFSTIAMERGGKLFHFPVARVNGFDFKEAVAGIGIDGNVLNRARRLRNVSLSTLYGLYCALEAWSHAGLNNADVDLSRVAIVSGGSNTQQAGLLSAQDEYREKLQFLNPNYGLNFFDTDIIGVVSQLLGITGEGHSLAAASASGNMAVIQAHRLIASKQYDVVLVAAPLMDISIYEYQAFTALGAMAPVNREADPKSICRPFDKAHCGFVYGQCAGSLVLESAENAAARGKKACGAVAGYGVCMDANRGPDPSSTGEKNAMLKAMNFSGIGPRQISYVNTHGTASVAGDHTEAEALLAIGLEGVKANSTKSLTGHGLSAAGLVEAVASLVQMNEGFVHRSNNLTDPITSGINWINHNAEPALLEYVMSNSFGFGGINTSIIFKNQSP